MALTDFVRVNGDVFSWKSCVMRVDNEDLSRKATALDYEQKRDRKQAYGNDRSGGPVGPTSGKYDPGTPSLSLFRDYALALKAYLANKAGGRSYGNAVFTFQMQLVEPNNDVVTVTFTECHIIGSKDSQKEGPDEITTDLTLQPKKIIETINGNDVVMYDDTEEV